MVIFYSPLNIAGINSMVLFSLQNPGKNMRRHKFLHMLASELVEDHIRNRGLQVNIPRNIRLMHFRNVWNTREITTTSSCLSDKSERKVRIWCQKKKQAETILM